MAGSKVTPVTPTASGSADDKQQRERSTIEFPYGDLNDALDIARAIHDNAGTSCSPDQLAGFMRQTVTSGAFRTKIGTARIFTLVETDRGSVTLTPLGRQIVDQGQERQARANAFLSVPLYRAVFDKFKGHLLPPAAALEREMRGFGVSQKQTDRARQAFERSAEQAGFFAHGTDRLIMPTGINRPETAPVETPKASVENGGGGSGGTGGGGSGLDPVISALIQKLPRGASSWPVDERVTWLQMVTMALQLAYGQVETIEIKKVP